MRKTLSLNSQTLLPMILLIPKYEYMKHNEIKIVLNTDYLYPMELNPHNIYKNENRPNQQGCMITL